MAENRPNHPVSLQDCGIKVDLLPEKKGSLLRKYTEYHVSSDKYKSQVSRRYSDFLALNNLLIQRYPYRLVPRLPPQKLAALYLGAGSDFADTRRKGLKRWLVLVSSHPVFSNDQMLEFFLTYMGEDHSSKFTDQFKSLPDEFLSHPTAHLSRDQVTSQLTSQVQAGRAKMSVITSVVNKALCILERMADRSLKNSADMAEFGRELTSLTNESFLPSGGAEGGWATLQSVLHSITDDFSSLSAFWRDHSKAQDSNTAETMRLLQDALLGYKDLCDRVDKNIPSDHKKGVEKIQAVKRRKGIGGILLEDPRVLEKIDKRIEDHEILLSDLEVRQGFSIWCLSKETEGVFVQAELLGSVVFSLCSGEIKGMEQLLEIWKKIRPAVEKLEVPSLLSRSRDNSVDFEGDNNVTPKTE